MEYGKPEVTGNLIRKGTSMSHGSYGQLTETVRDDLTPAVRDKVF